jgi:hypothetical protein
LSGLSTKASLEYQRISIDRTKLSEDEAFEHAIDMISSRQMGFRKAADFFQVQGTYWYFRAGGSQRDVVYLGWLIEPSNMRDLSQCVQLCTWSQIGNILLLKLLQSRGSQRDVAD